MGKIAKYILISLVTLMGIVAIVLFFRWITPTPLTNEQIVEQTKYCEDNGLKASRVINGWNYDVHKIICVPKD